MVVDGAGSHKAKALRRPENTLCANMIETVSPLELV